MNDSDLVARAMAGDGAAFGALVRQHQSMLRGFLRRLTRIAWSRFLMAMRARKTPDENAEHSEPGAESGSDARLDLEKAMTKLSVAERAALTLCYALEYSHDEASEILDMPLGTLKSHVLRGREKLRALLEAAS